MPQNLNRPNSGIATDSINTGFAGNEVQSGNSPLGAHQCHTATAYLQDPNDNNDGVLDIAQNSTSAPGGNEEGSIRQDQTGYSGS
jgi:hypothetical protein